MNKGVLYGLIVCLLVSNIYFARSTYIWQNEWFEQFITTSDVESVFKEKKGCRVTFEGLLHSEAAEVYTVAKPHNAALELGVDQKALLRGGTLLYFNNGEYAGSSKANLVGEDPWLLKMVQ